MDTHILIGIYWAGGEIPSWRQECTDRFLSLYSDATILKFIDTSPCERFTAIQRADEWKFGMASSHTNFLYIDSDIYLNERLCLPAGPALADEYGLKHWSIVWSGNNPSVFVGANSSTIQKDKRVLKLKITGTHWASDLHHNRVPRNI